nr:fatty-acid CoA ligase [Streptococcus thermophilus]
MTLKTFTVDAPFTVAPDENCFSVLVANAEKRPNTILFTKPEGHEWVDVTAAEFVAEVREAAKGLIALGAQKGDRIALLSGARYEWPVADFAIMAAGLTTAAIYPTSSLEQVQWIVEDSGAVIALGETHDHGVLFEHVTNSQLREVLLFDDGGMDTLKEAGRSVSDEELDERIAGITHDDIASLVYTSGTTGRAKGCIITHLNWIFQVRGLLAHPAGQVARRGNKVVTYLPLAHVMARSVHLAATLGETTQSHWQDVSTIAAEFQRVKPDLVLGVPRVYEKVRDAARRKASDGSAIGAKIFAEAEKTAIAYSEALDAGGPSMVLKAKRAVFDKLVYSKIREALGGKMEYGISGGSALGVPLGHFYRGAGLPVYEGYGLTETSSAAALSFGDDRKIGSVGKPMMGYTAKISDEGEICFSGPGVFTGYWGNEEATKEALIDGYFHTGDLGEIDEKGNISITGRKKDLLVTSGGKNVAPQPLEELLRQDPLISQAVVVGDGKPFIGALIALDEDALTSWKEARGIDADIPTYKLAKRNDLRMEIQDAVNRTNHAVSKAEAIKKFRILPRDLTEADGELTPSLKVKRPAVLESFAHQMRKLYG